MPAMPELDNSGRFRTAPASYAYATAIFVAALLVRLALESLVQSGPFLIFYTAVVVVYLLCGSGPGHWVAALSALAATLLFMQGTLAENLLYVAVFLVSGSSAGSRCGFTQILCGCVRLTPACIEKKRSTVRRSRRKAMRSSAWRPTAP
jgi:hypothetical protein